jgi:hypothetical protein
MTLHSLSPAQSCPRFLPSAGHTVCCSLDEQVRGWIAETPPHLPSHCQFIQKPIF